ncbi:hypothetical protein GP486_004590 [Trichoglossum hirsutum]|uniref:Uncharacterized protein n=1 Tax=Trichoglossum hirsutum TaxID=265104 RepID=A0A9P8LAW1_9PEZI|nr:hypothetical protein GP486_004590 [Trichoglossum hirsutum]
MARRSIPGTILEQVTSRFLSADQPAQRRLFKEQIAGQPVEEAIEALCSGDGARRLSPQSFSAMTRLLLKVEPCLAKERGLCILVESLARGRSRKADNATTAKFIRRKTEIGSQVLQHLLKYFTESTVPARFRRWVGFLLCELLKDSNENKEALEMGPVDRQRLLGSIALEDKNQNLKLISGLIISHQVMSGSNGELYWPPTINKERLVEFPEIASEDSQWLIGFQSFLEKFEQSQPQKPGLVKKLTPLDPSLISSSVPPEPFAVTLTIDNEDISHEGGISVALDGILTLLIPPSKGDPPQFIDIPFRNIKDVGIRPCQQAEVPPELLPDPPTDVVLHLNAHGGHTHYYNAREKSAGEIVVSFSGLSDAAAVAKYLKAKSVKVSESSRVINPTMSFINIEKKDCKSLSGELPPGKRVERWLGLNTGLFSDLGQHLIETLENSTGVDSENPKQREAREGMSSGVRLNVRGLGDGAGKERMPSDFAVPSPDGDDGNGESPTGELKQKLQGTTQVCQDGYPKPGQNQSPNDTRTALSPLSSPPQGLEHGTLEADESNARANGTIAGGGSDGGDGKTERSPIISRQQLEEATEKSPAGAGKRVAPVNSNRDRGVRKDCSSIYDLDPQGAPNPKKSTIKSRKKTVATKRPTAKTPPARSKELYPANKRARDVPTIPKEGSRLSTESTNWDEAFEEGEDHAVQPPTKRLKANGTTRPRPRSVKKAARAPLTKANASIRSPNSKPIDTVTSNKRKPAPVIPQPLRGSRAAAASANNRILKTDQGSENGSSIDTQQGKDHNGSGGDLGDDLVVHSQLDEKPSKLAGLTGSNVVDRSTAGQVDHISSPKGPPNISSEAIAARASGGIISTTMVNKLPVQHGVGLPGSTFGRSYDTVVQPTAENSVKFHNPLAGMKRGALSGLEKEISGASAILPSGLAAENESPFSDPATSIIESSRGISAGLEEVKPLEQGFKHSPGGQGIPGAKTDLEQSSKMVAKIHSALAAISVSPSDGPASKKDFTQLGVRKTPKGIPPKTPPGKRQQNTYLEEITEDGVNTASKKPKTGVVSKFPKADVNVKMTGLDEAASVRNKVALQTVPPTRAAPRERVDVIEISSDDSDGGSYYSDISSVLDPRNLARMQASKIREAGLALHRNVVGARGVTVKTGVELQPPQTRTDLTPKPGNAQNITLVNDRLSSKPKVVGWSGSGPRNQGRLVQKEAHITKDTPELISQPKQRPTQGICSSRLDAKKPQQQIAHVQENQSYQAVKLRHKGQPKLQPVLKGKGKGHQNTPNAQSSPKMKRQISPLFVPRTNEDVVLNRGESYTPSIVEFSGELSSHRARVEESGSPIPITKYYSQEIGQINSLRDAVTESISAKTVNDLEEEFSLGEDFAGENQITALTAGDTNLTKRLGTIFSSNQKHGPRSPRAASEIKFVGQEAVNIIRTAKAPPDPFAVLHPKRVNSFMQKLQAKGVEVKSPAKRNCGGSGQTTIKRIKKSLGRQIEQPKEDPKMASVNLRQDPDKTLVDPESELEQPSSSSGVTMRSGASQSTSGSSSSNDKRWSLKKDLKTQWRKSLKPHQSNMLDVLYQISDVRPYVDLVRHLVDKEVCIEDVVHDYQRSGTKLIQELEKTYQGDYDACRVALGEARLTLKDMYSEARRHINGGMKQLKGDSVAMAKKDWNESQRALLCQLRAVVDFVNA